LSVDVIGTRVLEPSETYDGDEASKSSTGTSV